MRLVALFLLFATAPIVCANAQVHQRGIHSHGEGELKIAIEGNAIAMELRLPGADAVGFERLPTSQQESSAVALAIALLEDPEQILVPSATAGCRLENASARFETKASEDAGHTEFSAAYRYSCSNIDALEHLSFAGFFEHFPNTSEIEILVVSDYGSVATHAVNDAPDANIHEAH